MKITAEEIKKTAALAKIAIDESEAALYAKQLSAVLDWVGELQAVDTSAVEGECAGAAPMREDTAITSPAAADIVAAFNDKQDNLLKVKKVL